MNSLRHIDSWKKNRLLQEGTSWEKDNLSRNRNPWSTIKAHWNKMCISSKFLLAFGLLFTLIIVVAVTGYVALKSVSSAERSIQASHEIQRLVLEMNRGMERARRLHNSFFLEYPLTGFESARKKYLLPSLMEIEEVIKTNARLKEMLSYSTSGSPKDYHINNRIKKNQIDLNLYLSSARRFADTSLESVELITKLALPEKGLEANLEIATDVLLSVSDVEDGLFYTMNKELERLKYFCYDISMLSLEYRVARKRFLMQSAFNVGFKLKMELKNSISINNFKRSKLLYFLDIWFETAEDILMVDAAIKGKFNDFAIQSRTVYPISRKLVQLADKEVEQARKRINNAYSIAIKIIIMVTVSGLLCVILIFRVLDISITKRIIVLTESASKLRQGHLELSIQNNIPLSGKDSNLINNKTLLSSEESNSSSANKEIYEDDVASHHGEDELGELSRIFDLMTARLNALVNNLEEKVLQRTSELAESQKKLQRAEKMEAIGMLAGGVAHDLNNILSAVIGYPEIILMSIPAGSELEKPVKAIKESGQRAAAVVADLLTLARGAASTKSKEDINALIQQYIDSPEFQKLQESYSHVSYNVNYASDIYNISCSGIHIKKTIMNLLTNASEAIHGSGEITISTYNSYFDKKQAAQKEIKEGRYVVINVVDTGEGISADDLKHIFEPFYTKKVMGKSGTGLGLTVVWNTVQDHNGSIKVTSKNNGVLSVIYSSFAGSVSLCNEELCFNKKNFWDKETDLTPFNGSGTSFELYFPALNDEISQESSEGHSLTDDNSISLPLVKLAGRGEKVLVVDDEPHQIDLSRRMLTILNYDVVAADSGEKAVEYLKQNNIDLVILDMIMAPGINGRETYEKIVKINPAQKAIIASGFSESVDVKKLLEMGVSSYLKKPYSIEQLARAVKEALNVVTFK